jgi:NTP pyrophosphatase (non-canonical NTP hydrolase)
MNDLKNNPTLTDLQKHIKQICAEKGWDKNTVTEIYLLFSEETGELAKGIRKVTGFKGESAKNAMSDLENEFADVLMYLMDLANYFGIDLETAYRKKIKVNETRQWK